MITDAAVCGIDVDSACVPDNRVRHAFEIVEGRLRTPESSERKERDVAPVGAGHSWANGHLSVLITPKFHWQNLRWNTSRLKRSRQEPAPAACPPQFSHQIV